MLFYYEPIKDMQEKTNVVKSKFFILIYECFHVSWRTFPGSWIKIETKI